ncbi:helix-turn-helix domain-containing protein [Phyllobacterium lublinensis]|uniref:helix-turn-helix domain-containing protein n=1 Tax=Phyllobacterium lublinensis TaxID=2875708 RepID=UPI001CCE7278|nr:helix-turn-helix domain-containing protein [Phyllobacterium sp. 2063]MBZ9655043.1 helix-turn-helix domain-containing protein [Phyllobacterium sp. 2063]
MSAAWFAALPIEIMLDKKVPPAIRVLCAITKFDRVGKNGRGCFATQSTIAQETALDIGSVKRWIKYWVDLGYLSSEKDKKDARKRVLRVVYKSRGDEASEIGRTSATNPNKDRSQNAPEIGRTTEKYDEENHKFTSRKYREKQIVLNDEANAEETAPFSLRKTGASISSREENIGGLLAQIERDFKAEPSLR